MTIIKFKKIKFKILLLIWGLIFAIVFTFLLFMNQLNQIKVRNNFKNFDNTSTYKIILKEDKNCESSKKILAKDESYSIFGFCINNIYLNYNNVSISLNKALKERYITINEILKDSNLISSNSTIKRYENQNTLITISNLYDQYTEVIFSLKD